MTNMEYVTGLGHIDKSKFILSNSCADNFFVGENGVVEILTTLDKKVDFIVCEGKTLAHVSSSMGYPAIYMMEEPTFEPQAEVVLMDLDGTSVHSEQFWMWIIQKTIAALMEKPQFELENGDEPYVSGHSVSEHLLYCIHKYCPDKSVENARELYYQITDFEMTEIMQGRGRKNAFTPAPNLKEFLYKLKENEIKIGLVTSGVYNKAWPEILSAFQTLNMGNPEDFYDSIITAGSTLRKGTAGTLGELAPKPHPWLYSEAARVGLGVTKEKKIKTIGLEDSAAGVLSLRLAGFACIGVDGGNILKSGTDTLCCQSGLDLMASLDIILGR